MRFLRNGGDVMKPSVLFVLATAMAGGLYAIQPQPIRADQAKGFVGQFVIVEDAVAQVTLEPQSGYTYLNFGGEFPNQIFRVVVPATVGRLLERGVLQAGRVRVRGIPQLGATGVPEIVCSDPAQLTAAGTSTDSPLPTVAAPPPPSAPLPVVGTPPPPAKPCCRVCSTGKPCGNSCIARSSTCRQPPGCAC